MTQQLYINGIAVDMPQDEVKIKVASNLFGDVSKVMSAHSYNIALPRTMANDALFALAFLPTAATAGLTTHTYLRASLYVDGVPVFSDGRALVTSVNERGYNINLFWGVVDILNQIKEEDLKLCDLPMSAHWDEDTMANWVELPHRFLGLVTMPSGMDDDIYDTLTNDGKAIADKRPWQMPVIPATDILAKIAQVYGLTITMSPAMTSRVADIYHPLVSLHVLADGEKAVGNVAGDNVSISGTPALRWVHSINTDVPQLMTGLLNMDVDQYREYLAPRHDTTITFGKCHIHGRAKTQFEIYYTDAWQNGCGSPSAATYDGYQWRYPSTLGDDGWWHIDVEFFNVTANGKSEYHDPVPVLQQVHGATIDPTPPELECDFEIVEGGELNVGDYWCFERNYPELKVINYINELLAHCGGFVVGSITDRNTLHVTTYDEVVGAASVDVDCQGVTNIGMTLDNLAQHNHYTHKENDDDGLKYEAAGELLTDDVTLKFENTAFSSAFKVPRTNLVKLWDVKAVDGGNEPSWSASGDYIVTYAIATGGSGRGVNFADVLARHYTNYADIIRTPKVVEVSVHMSVLELLGIDFTRPMRVRQLGGRFVVLSVENESGENYKIKLIQI